MLRAAQHDMPLGVGANLSYATLDEPTEELNPLDYSKFLGARVLLDTDRS